jgi:hypothetical protein
MSFPDGIHTLVNREGDTGSAFSLSCEDTAKKGSPLQIGRLLSSELHLDATLFLDFQPPDCQKINVCCLYRPICGILL